MIMRCICGSNSVSAKLRLINRLSIAKANNKVPDFSLRHQGTSLVLLPFQYDILPLLVPRYIKLAKNGSLYLKPSGHAHEIRKLPMLMVCGSLTSSIVM